MVGGLPVRLRRSQRRTISLKVTPEGLTVYAPRRTAVGQLRQLVETKRGWAEGHLQTYRQRDQGPWVLAGDMALPYLGTPLTLKVVPGLKKTLRQGDELHLPEGPLAAHAERWYRAQAPGVFQPLVEQYAAQLGRGRPLKAVRVTNASRRWGSCSADGVVRLHWRLLLAPPDVLAYVAAHEAAHLAELNHSPRYWAEVERLFPDHPAARQWLKAHGAALMRSWA
ncbi:M48 family peptidase [Deinococcus irradiatisoli]|uniref:M48 family peptidase n=1 Tax=Deinococcus irradiatisoli TaxID=2202254 RepID=A0A2Z3JIG6_9DEIO|nr:M48 family peptidase [Deinococcus irradiatisoli]